MALILSRPKRASGTRFTNEITTTSDKSDVTRVQKPDREERQDQHHDSVGWPDPARWDQPPDRVGEMIREDVMARLDQFHQVAANPGVRAEKTQ